MSFIRTCFSAAVPLSRIRLLVWIDWRVSLCACKVTFADLWSFDISSCCFFQTNRPHKLCDAFLTTAGAASGHSKELSLAQENELQQLVAHQVPSQWRKKHGCCQPPGCNVSPGWRELIYAEKKYFHLDVDQKYVQQKWFYEKLKKTKHKFPIILC